MTDVAVVIAYRDLGCAHRRRSFGWVRDWYRWALGVEPIVWSGEDDDTFSRARGANEAIKRASADVVVQSDPDSVVPLPQLTAAIDLARAADGLVIPHDRYLYLEPGPTWDVLTGTRQLGELGPGDCHDSGPNGVGNVAVFSRETWRVTGGFDERFGMWGGDDAAFAYAAEALVNPLRRLHGDVIHLYHPRLPQSEPGHPGYAAQFEILAAYRDAANLGGHAAVRELVLRRGDFT